MNLKKKYNCSIVHNTLIFVFVLFKTTIAITQITNGSDNKLFVSVSPLSLIDYKDGSSLRLSLDAKIYKRLAFSVENVVYTSLGNFFAYKKDPKGFAIKPLIKYYFNKENKMQGLYAGIEYMYKHQTYQLNDSFSINPGVVYYKEYLMSRYINCVSVKFGEVTNFKKHIVFESFCGIGLRFFKSNTSLPISEYNVIIRDEEHFNNTGGGYQARTIGNKILPNILLGIKLGYLIY